MARNYFHVDHKRLREELGKLTDNELFEEYDASNETLHGPDSLGIDMVQDSAVLEGMAVRDRAILKIAGEILRERGAMDAMGNRTAVRSQPQVPELEF